MSLLSRPKQLGTALLAGVDRLFGFAGSVGAGGFAWPVTIGMGLGVGLFGLFQPAFVHGLTKRRATMEWMRHELVAVAAATFAVLVVTLTVAVLRRRRGTASSVREAYAASLRGAAVLAALPFVVALREPFENRRGWLALGFIAVVTVLVGYSTYHTSRASTASSGGTAAESQSRFARLAAPLVLALLAAGYALVQARLAIANHRSFETGHVDLGNYVSLFRESSHGRLLGCSACTSGRHPVHHFEPLFALLSPIYLLHPFAETLLVLQAVWLASGAAPVYLLARERSLGRRAALGLGVAYLLYPALHGTGLYPFHSIAFAVPLLLWLLLFLERRATRAYVVTLVLVLLAREDMPLALLGVGVVAIVAGGPKARLGWLTVALASLYAVLVSTFAHVRPLDAILAPGTTIEAALSPRRGAFDLAGLPGNLLEQALTEPNLEYAAVLALPLLALPLLAPGRLTLLYGGFVAFLLVHPTAGSLDAGQAGLLIPFAFALTASALGRLRSGELRFGQLSGPRLSGAASAALVVATLLCSLKFGGLVENGTFRATTHALGRSPTKEQLATAAWLKRFARSLPKGAKIAASAHLLPHLGSASRLYMLDDRAGSDYVVAGMKTRSVARALGGEETKGLLVQVEAYADVRVYKTRYRGQLPRAQRQLEDE